MASNTSLIEHSAKHFINILPSGKNLIDKDGLLSSWAGQHATYWSAPVCLTFPSRFSTLSICICFSNRCLSLVDARLFYLASFSSFIKSETFHARRPLMRIGLIPIGAQSRQAHLRRVWGLRLMNLHASLVGSTWGKTIGWFDIYVLQKFKFPLAQGLSLFCWCNAH